MCLFSCTGEAHANSQADELICANNSGVWFTPLYGNQTSGYCILPTSDAGQVCEFDNDCESACITDDEVKAGSAATGECFGWSELISHCLNSVDDGKALGTVCYD